MCGWFGSDRVERAVELDRSFDEFVADNSARLLRTAFLLTGGRELAEDLLQVALVRTARRWEVASRSPHAYAHRVLVNLVHDRRRHLRRRVSERPLGEFDVGWSPIPEGVEGLIDRVALIGAVRRLPQRQREVVVLRFFAGLSVAETAAGMGATEGTIKTHTSRALAALRAALTAEETKSNIAAGP